MCPMLYPSYTARTPHRDVHSYTRVLYGPPTLIDFLFVLLISVVHIGVGMDSLLYETRPFSDVLRSPDLPLLGFASCDTAT